VNSLCGTTSSELRIIVIPNTLFLSECLVSESVMVDLSGKQGMEFDANSEEFAFDDRQRLLLRIP